MNETVTPAGSQVARREARFDQERVAELYALAKPAYLVTPLNGAILALILWGPISAEVVVMWLLGLAAVTAARAWVHYAYLRSDTRRSGAAVWERRFCVGANSGSARA